MQKLIFGTLLQFFVNILDSLKKITPPTPAGLGAKRQTLEDLKILSVETIIVECNI
jgi:hypothetical protein